MIPVFFLKEELDEKSELEFALRIINKRRKLRTRTDSQRE